MKELPVTDPADLAAGYTSIRVHNFWMDGKTGEVQAVLAKCKSDGTPAVFFDMPRQKLDPTTFDSLLATILKHGQISDVAAKAASDDELRAAKKAHEAKLDELKKAFEAKSDEEKKAAPLVLPELKTAPPYQRVLPDGAVK